MGLLVSWKEGSGTERVAQELLGQVADSPPSAQNGPLWGCHLGALVPWARKGPCAFCLHAK